MNTRKRFFFLLVSALIMISVSCFADEAAEPIDAKDIKIETYTAEGLSRLDRFFGAQNNSGINIYVKGKKVAFLTNGGLNKGQVSTFGTYPFEAEEYASTFRNFLRDLSDLNQKVVLHLDRWDDRGITGTDGSNGWAYAKMQALTDRMFKRVGDGSATNSEKVLQTTFAQTQAQKAE